MTASAVYNNLPLFVSSHSFVNLYAVDFINYVKSGGKSLREDVNLLDVEDFDSDDDSKSSRKGDLRDEKSADTGFGQGARPIREKLSEDAGGGVRVTIVRDIDDYINRGEELRALSPYLYKALIRRVSKKQIDKRSKAVVHAGAQKSQTFDFDPEHPLAHSHVQRLNMKPLIVTLVRRGLPRVPGPWSYSREVSLFLKRHEVSRESFTRKFH